MSTGSPMSAQLPPSQPDTRTRQAVVIVGLQIPFSDILGLLLTTALASIPAGILIGGLYLVMWIFFRGFLS